MPVLSEGTGIRKEIIGVVHLLALPGSPGWQGNLDEVVGHALRDAEALARGGVNAVIFENFGDVPFLTGPAPPEAVAAMAVVIDRVAKSIDVPFGVNVLRNDPIAALGLAYATGGEFIRVNVHTGVMVTDQGIIEGGAAETVRRRSGLGADVKLLADVMVKHAVPLGEQDIRDAAKAAVQRGLADALIVTGPFTGEEADMSDVRAVKEAAPEGTPVLVGSGVTEENIGAYMEWADGVIVGTSMKVGGVVSNPVDCERVARLVSAGRG